MFGVSMDTGGLIQRLNEFVVPSSAQVLGDLCRNHSHAYLHALHKAAGWAVKMWDSSAKAQTGLMTGNLNSLGNFDECISVRNIRNYDTYFSGQHCLATLKVNNISASDAMGKTFEQIMAEETEINIGLGSLLSKGLRWGFCIPSSCTSEDLAAELSEFIGNTSGVDVSIDKTDCHFDQHKIFRSADWVAIVIFFAIMLCVVISTLYESLKGHLHSSDNVEIPLPISTVVAENLRCGLQSVFPRRMSVFVQASYSSKVNRRTESVENTPCMTGQSQTSAARQLHKYTKMTGQVTTKGERFWSRGTSATPTSSEIESYTTSSPEETQIESGRPQSQDLPGPSQAGLNPSSRESSAQTHYQTFELERQNQALQERNEEVLGFEGNNSLTRVEATPTAGFLEDDNDPWSTFSLISNGKKIFRFEDSTVKLLTLHGMKFLSVCWVLIGHTCLIAESLPAVNYVTVKDYTTRWFAMPILNASLAVDTFMVITGLLTSYNFLRDMRHRGIYRRNSNRLVTTGLKKKFLIRYIPVYYFHRQFRLTPTLAAIILLQVSLLGHFGSGPFWKSGNVHLSEKCRDGWAGTLSYLQNFFNPDNICPTHSWYLMVDMQLYTISPLILLFLLAWNKRRSLIFIAVLTAMGLPVCFLANYLLELPVGFRNEDPSKWQLKTQYDYMATYTRFGPWMVGIGVGYILHCFKRSGKIQLQMKPFVVFLGWTLSMAALMFAIFGLFPFQQPHYKYNAVWSSLYSSSYHTIWALGVGWIILACESNNGGVIRTILSWKLFQPLGRLTFCIYLVHLPLITTRSLMTRVPIYFDGATALSSVLGDLLSSILLATVLSLFVEMPFIRLFRYVTIRLGMPMRQTPRHSGDPAEYVALLRDLDSDSRQSTSEQPPETPQHSDNSKEAAAIINGETSVQTVSVAQQTDPKRGSSSSTLHNESTSEEAIALPSGSHGTLHSTIRDHASTELLPLLQDIAARARYQSTGRQFLRDDSSSIEVIPEGNSEQNSSVDQMK